MRNEIARIIRLMGGLKKKTPMGRNQRRDGDTEDNRHILKVE